MSIGIAKPMPTFPLTSELLGSCALMPITAPERSISGPPELPWLIAASVCSALLIAKLFGAEIWRWIGGDDARGQRAVEPERVADGDDGVADLDARGVTERQRVQGARGEVDLEDGEVGRGVRADDPRAHVVAVRERDAHALLALDHVLVGQDVAGGVEHDPRSLCRAPLPERRDDRDDARGVGLVDRLERPLGPRVDVPVVADVGVESAEEDALVDASVFGACTVVTSWTVTVAAAAREPLSTEAVTIAAIAPPASAATRAITPTAGVSRRERG